MSLIKNGKHVKFYLLKFLREIGPRSTGAGLENVLHKTFCYVVGGFNERDAIKTFLLQDISHSPLSLEIRNEAYYFDGKIPLIVQRFNKLAYDENDMNELVPEDNEEDAILYHQFIKENLDLMIDVLLVLKDKSIMFKIEETELII